MLKPIITTLCVFIFFCSQPGFSQNSVKVSELIDKEGVTYYNNKPYTGEIFEMHPPLFEGGESSQKSLSGYLKDGKAEGEFIYYFENGKVFSVKLFKNGIVQKMDSYYINGNFAVKYVYKNGELDGIQKEYHENGNIAVQVGMKNGIKEGVFEQYHENGQLAIRGTFKNGERDGNFIWKDENGKVLKKETYTNGAQEKDNSTENFCWECIDY